jgi:trigger factor
MQVTETLSEGLKREYKVVVPASELDAKVNARLDQLKSQVRINGFRPGKVPVAHLKRMYGRATMAEVIESTVRDTNNQIVSERGFKVRAILPTRSRSRSCRRSRSAISRTSRSRSRLPR